MAEREELEAERATLEGTLARLYQVPPPLAAVDEAGLRAHVAELRRRLEGAVAPRRVFDGIKIAVDRVSVPRRDGGHSDKDVVAHPGSVLVLPLLGDGERVVLIKNARVAVGRWLWELPAGTLERGEDPRDCAMRELAEETGYEAREMSPLLTFFPAPGTSSERMHAFVARGLRRSGGQRLEPTENIEVVEMTPEEAAAMIDRHEIEDAKTIAVLLYHLRVVSR